MPNYTKGQLTANLKNNQTRLEIAKENKAKAESSSDKTYWHNRAKQLEKTIREIGYTLKRMGDRDSITIPESIYNL